MANPKMDILDVVRKRLGEDETDFLQDALSAFLRALMEAEVNTQAGAAYGERSGERVSQRNGYRDRRWDTRAGTLDLAIPRLRTGSYFPTFLEPRRRSEQALLAVIQQA